MSDIITGNRLRVLAFGVNTGTLETTLLYPMRSEKQAMLQRPDPKCQDNYSIGTRVSDIRAALAEIERLREELATILMWSQLAMNAMYRYDESLMISLVMNAPEAVRQGA